MINKFKNINLLWFLICVKSPNNNSTIKIRSMKSISGIIIQIWIPPSFSNYCNFLILFFSKINLYIQFISFYFTWILYDISYFCSQSICFFSIFLIIFTTIMICFKCLINYRLYSFLDINFIKSIKYFIILLFTFYSILALFDLEYYLHLPFKLYFYY